MITSVASAVVAGVPPCFSGPATHVTVPVFAVFESLSRTTTFDGCSWTIDGSPTAERTRSTRTCSFSITTV